jgi:RNA polymerase sigma-54 factor
MAQPPSLGLRTGGTLRPVQRQSLSVGLRQGMALLSLPALDLHAELARQAAENPFLVVERPLPTGRILPGADDADALGRIAATPSLADHLRTQISCMDLAPRIRALALHFAADLDDRGYLPGTDDEIAESLGVPAADVAQARAALHACEPTGVGAATLGECLALQLIEQGVAAETAHDLVRHLGALADGRFAAVGRALGVTAEEARALAGLLRQCTPDPAGRFGTPEARPLLPELTIERTRLGGLILRLLDDPAATVSLDTALMARAAAGSAAFAPQRQAAARRLVAAVAFRSRTLLRVGEALLEAQAAYFMGKSRAPAPLRRAEIAERLGLHPATVGRAVKGRGLLFEGQVRPMGWYFPAGLSTGLAGPENQLSQPEIMARMRDLVAAETAGTVLSDEAIALRLREDGVDIARRTVAKYRQCLHIPPSSRRRRLLARKAGAGAREGGVR